MSENASAAIRRLRPAAVLGLLTFGAVACSSSTGSSTDRGAQGPDYRTIEVFDGSSGTWMPLQGEMRAGRSVSASGVIGGLLYVAGGSRLAPKTVFSGLEAYDPAADSWTTRTALPTAREGAAAGVIADRLYVAGGGNATEPVSILEIYDPVSNSWSAGTTMSVARAGAAAGVINSKLYVVGGNDLSTILDTMEVYDPATDSWSMALSLPTPRSQAAAAVLEGKLYVIGGYLDTKVVSPLVEVYDPGTNTWSSVAPMPTARAEAVAGVISGMIYVAGGNLSSNPDIDEVTDTLEIYNPVRDEWTTGPPMLSPRAEATEGVIGGKLYVAGGFNR